MVDTAQPTQYAVDRLFLGVQLVVVVFSIIVTFLFGLQNVSDCQRRHTASAVIGWKLLAHRVGLLACVFFSLLSVDPSGIHGILSVGFRLFLLGNATCLLLCLVARYLVASVQVMINYGLQGKPRTRPLVVALYAVVVAAFVINNAVSSFMLKYDRMWFRAMWLFFTDFFIVVYGGLFMYMSAVIVRALNMHVNLATAETSIKLRRYRKKLIVLMWLCGVIGILVMGLATTQALWLLEHRDEPLYEADRSSFQWEMDNCLDIVFAQLLLIIFLWDTWMRLRPCCAWSGGSDGVAAGLLSQHSQHSVNRPINVESSQSSARSAAGTMNLPPIATGTYTPERTLPSMMGVSSDYNPMGTPGDYNLRGSMSGVDPGWTVVPSYRSPQLNNSASSLPASRGITASRSYQASSYIGGVDSSAE